MAHQKPQPAEGAAADVNLATASSEGAEGRCSKEEPDCGWEMTGGAVREISQSGHSVCWALLT